MVEQDAQSNTEINMIAEQVDPDGLVQEAVVLLGNMEQYVLTNERDTEHVSGRFEKDTVSMITLNQRSTLMTNMLMAMKKDHRHKKRERTIECECKQIQRNTRT